VDNCAERPHRVGLVGKIAAITPEWDDPCNIIVGGMTYRETELVPAPPWVGERGVRCYACGCVDTFRGEDGTCEGDDARAATHGAAGGISGGGIVTPERLEEIENEWDGYSPSLCGKHIPELAAALREAWGVMDGWAKEATEIHALYAHEMSFTEEEDGMGKRLREFAARLRRGRGV